MRHHYALGILLAGLAFAGSAQLSAQDETPGNQILRLIPDGKTVYDTVNQVTWLADANLSATERFGIPLCESTEPTAPCMYASGSMNYESAMAWIAGMNAANYLGHHDWQLPTTPLKDRNCREIGPSSDSFGFGCDANALGYLYYKALGFKAPNTAVPIPPNEVGPFRNFQPSFYWSDSFGGGLPGNIANFNFANGSQDGATGSVFLYVLPMIKGKISGTPPAVGTGLEVNPGGQTVYDPMADVTWLADANLAATAFETLGLARCETPATPKPCIARDGSMDYDSAVQFIANMNAHDHGAGYLGQTDWQLPPSNANCPIYNCTDKGNPMGELFYNQFHLLAGQPVVETPHIAVGPFHYVQPDYYWSCLAATIKDVCETTSPVPNEDAEWDFSFGNGFLSTARMPADHFVTAYFPGCDLHDPGKCLAVP